MYWTNGRRSSQVLSAFGIVILVIEQGLIDRNVRVDRWHPTKHKQSNTGSRDRLLRFSWPPSTLNLLVLRIKLVFCWVFLNMKAAQTHDVADVLLFAFLISWWCYWWYSRCNCNVETWRTLWKGDCSLCGNKNTIIVIFNSEKMTWWSECCYILSPSHLWC